MTIPSQHSIRFHIDSIFSSEVASLPWHVPIMEWERTGIQTLKIKHGMSRHPVIFVKAGRFSFAIKEISEVVSQKEIRNYEDLLLREIHTLVPVGYVVRDEAALPLMLPHSIQYETNTVSHTITLLVDKVIPDSELFRRGFTLPNRKKIWNAIAKLFAELHSKGVYWGDASLANTLIKFDKVYMPLVGKKTVLTAYLADAETVEIHPHLSAAMRENDLNFFFESMEWIQEDLRASGLLGDPLVTEEASAYLRSQYHLLMAVEERMRDFERKTALNIGRFLGAVPDPSYVDIFLKHIEEHMWYLSERSKKSVGIKNAAQDWYKKIFIPVCIVFREEGILDYFPGKTAGELYIEIMTNKYLLSQTAQKDIGMTAAMRDYVERFCAPSSAREVLKRIIEKILSIAGIGE